MVNERIEELMRVSRATGASHVADDEAAKLDQLASAEVDSAVATWAARDLRALKENLAWLDSEEGGFCDVCGEEIASARLLALPTTRVCVGCASDREEGA